MALASTQADTIQGIASQAPGMARCLLYFYLRECCRTRQGLSGYFFNAPRILNLV